MCDFSLQSVASRPAKVGDKLITRHFGTGTRGFSDFDDHMTAVCVLPGTEIAFDADIKAYTFVPAQRLAIFRQINKDDPFKHHDCLELPGGEQILLTYLHEGQTATVLQLPAKPKNDEEAKEQTRLEIVA